MWRLEISPRDRGLGGNSWALFLFSGELSPVRSCRRTTHDIDLMEDVSRTDKSLMLDLAVIKVLVIIKTLTKHG